MASTLTDPSTLRAQLGGSRSPARRRSPTLQQLLSGRAGTHVTLLPDTCSVSTGIHQLRACRCLEGNLDVVPSRLGELLLEGPRIWIVVGHEGNQAELALTLGMALPHEVFV